MKRRYPEESLKKQYQRLTQNRARARRSGQPTPKLDARIEKLQALMGSTVESVKNQRPGGSNFTDYKGVDKRPLQAGAFMPK